ncbi:TPA: hypothetical protein ACJX9T_001921 [Neisseria gonorrhoeae]
MPSEAFRRHFYQMQNTLRLRGNDEFRDYGVVGRVSRLRCCRTGFEITVLSGMTVRVFYCARPAPVNGGRVKNAV